MRDEDFQRTEHTPTPTGNKHLDVPIRDSPRAKTILRYAIYSRLIILTAAALFGSFLSDYDSSARLNTSESSATHRCGPLEYFDGAEPCTWGRAFLETTRAFTRPLKRWDAFYFLHIADEGYIWEQEFAFFPLMPALTRFAADTILWPLSSLLPAQDRYVIAGIFVANLSFVLAALALYRLTLRVFTDERMAFLAALCFCITPAGIFMSSIYTESIYALFTFLGLSMLIDGRYLSAASLWCLAGTTRANGIVYCGFFVWEFAIRSGLQWRLRNSKNLLLVASEAIPYCFVVVSGFVAFQWYAHEKFCARRSVLGARPWCAQSGSIYSFVQKEYWNNGFMNYWTLQQLPNFLLAAPMIGFSAFGIWTYARADWKRFLSLGTHDRHVARPRGGKISRWWSFVADELSIRTNHPTIVSQEYYRSPHLLPHVYLWSLLLLLNVFGMHVQIITRFFTSLPVLYWFAASILLYDDGSERRRRDGRRAERNKMVARGVVTFALMYAAVGVPLFAGFFPPA